MNVYVIPQAVMTAAFLRAVLLGLTLGGIYDLTRAPRRAFSLHWLALTALDSVYILLLSALFFRFFVVWAYGLPRACFVVGIAFGIWLYLHTLSPLVLLLLVTVLTVLYKLIALPIRLVSRLFGIVSVRFPLEKIQKKRKKLFHFRTK